MQAGIHEILFTALLIVPTCLGLWREGRTDRQGVLNTVLERRKAERRMGKRTLHDRRANYHYLGPVPAAEPLPLSLDPGRDRRMAERRGEDVAYQSRELLPQHSTIRVFSSTMSTSTTSAPTTRQAVYQEDIPALERSRFSVEQTSAAHLSGGSDPA